jgi:anthranilate synthase component 1
VICSPDLAQFSRLYDSGAAQLVWTRIVDDLETPVSAYLKIGHGQAHAFLFESVEGGAWRGRYSVIALRPDLIWRCYGERAEISQGEDLAAGRFRTEPDAALDSLRNLVARNRMDLPPGLPPMAGGLFGAIGYDMIRLVERLPNVNPDPLGLPDGLMIRPSVVAIFDSIGQEIVLTTTARPGRRRRGASRMRPSPSPPRSTAPPMEPWSRRPSAISRPATSSRWCQAIASAPISASTRSPSIDPCGG